MEKEIDTFEIKRNKIKNIYELNVKDEVYQVKNNIENDIYETAYSLYNFDGIILYSNKLRTGEKFREGLYRGGKHVNVGAALVKKGYTLKDMERDDLNIYYMNPQLYYTEELEN